MNYANIKSADTCNGPGVRVSLFCSGCTHHCKGCFNQEAQDFGYGKEFTNEVLKDLLDRCDKPYISGLSLLGGEPCHPNNYPTILKVAKAFKDRFPNKTVWLWSGYTWEQLDFCRDLLYYIDVLVDGKFIEEQKNLSIPFRGSSNQRIIDVQESLTGNFTLHKLYN